jgi:hypothetical protein
MPAQLFDQVFSIEVFHFHGADYRRAPYGLSNARTRVLAKRPNQLDPLKSYPIPPIYRSPVTRGIPANR